MILKLKRTLQFGYGTALIILLAAGLAAWFTVINLLDTNYNVKQSLLVTEKLEKVLSATTNAETGQRGYLLTGNKAFLEPYNGSLQRAVKLIGEAENLSRADTQQQQNIAQIRQILTTRMSSLNALIDKKDRGESVSATDLAAGKADMDALRAAVTKAEKHQDIVSERRVSVFGHNAASAPVFIAIALLLGVVVALFSYFHALRDVDEKDKLLTELAKSGQESATANEELSAANREISAASEEITVANEELATVNMQLISSREDLENTNRSLEERVTERTRSLIESQAETQALNEELVAINEELTRAKNEAEKNEKLFRSIAVNIPGSIVVLIDTEQRLLALEGDRIAMEDIPAKDHLGKRLGKIMPPERYEPARELFERVLSGEKFRVWRKAPDGTDLQVDFVPLKNEDDIVYAALIIALDTTVIKQAEERSAKLAAIVDSSDDAIVGKTLEGIITSWNKGAERMFGFSEAEMIGASILKIIPKNRHPEELEIISQIKSGNRIEHFETKRQTSTGKLLDVSLTISPIRDNEGNIIGVSKIARDISERKLEEQRKNDFIGMVSHELKTPLTILSALLQVVERKLIKSADNMLTSAVGKANVQIRKMTTMINGFLNLSRLESGKMVIDKQQFNLDDLVREIVSDAELMAPTHTFLLACKAVLPVDADHDKIGSVISNLLNNAIKYSPGRGGITVSCEKSGSNALVSVKDEGIGIKQQDMKKLFERFYRASDLQSRHISGFGIGLYLSAEIIKRHNGNIWAESQPGEGSVFHFTLPLAN